jgi:hypothetical protein
MEFSDGNIIRLAHQSWTAVHWALYIGSPLTHISRQIYGLIAQKNNALSMRDNEVLMTISRQRSCKSFSHFRFIAGTETLRLSVIRTALNMIPKLATMREPELLESKVPGLLLILTLQTQAPRLP